MGYASFFGSALIIFVAVVFMIIDFFDLRFMQKMNRMKTNYNKAPSICNTLYYSIQFFLLDAFWVLRFFIF